MLDIAYVGHKKAVIGRSFAPVICTGICIEHWVFAMSGNTQAQGRKWAEIGRNCSALLSLKGLEVVGQLQWAPLWDLNTRCLIVFIDLPNSF